MGTVDDDRPASDEHVANVCRTRRVGARREQMLGAGSGQPWGFQVYRDQIGHPSGGDSATLGPAETELTALGGRTDQLGGGVVHALSAGEPLVELAGAGFLEGVDHRVRVAAEREVAPRIDQPAGAADSVGQVSRSVVGHIQQQAPAPPSS